MELDESPGLDLAAKLLERLQYSSNTGSGAFLPPSGPNRRLRWMFWQETMFPSTMFTPYMVQ